MKMARKILGIIFHIIGFGLIILGIFIFIIFLLTNKNSEHVFDMTMMAFAGGFFISGIGYVIIDIGRVVLGKPSILP